jgi:hypothetical protein
MSKNLFSGSNIYEKVTIIQNGELTAMRLDPAAFPDPPELICKTKTD